MLDKNRITLAIPGEMFMVKHKELSDLRVKGKGMGSVMFSGIDADGDLAVSTVPVAALEQFKDNEDVKPLWDLYQASL